MTETQVGASNATSCKKAAPRLTSVVCRFPVAPLRHQNPWPIRGVGPGHLAELRFGAGRGIAALSPASLVDSPWVAAPPFAASGASDFASLPALTQVKCSGLPMRVPREAGAPTNLSFRHKAGYTEEQ